MQNTCLRTSAPNDGDVAQLGEHHVRNVGVVGSNPIISTIEIPTGQAIAWPVLFCMIKGFEPLRLIGQIMCLILGVDAGQRPFFMGKVIRIDFPTRTKSVSCY